MNRLRTSAALALALGLAACSGQPETTTAPALPALATVTVHAQVGGATRAWDGVVEAVQQADLAAQTSGRITTVAVDVNDRVKAGDVLLRLTAVEQQAGADAARAQVRAAEANAVEAEANYARFVALAGKQYVSRLQLDQAKAARDAAVAARDAARAQLAQAGQQAGYTVVRAPFAGIVSARRVEPGEAVAPGQPLLSLYAPGALRLEVQVPQSDAEAIRAAPKATVQVDGGAPVAAAQVIVFPAADPLSHSIGVRVVLPALAQPVAPGVTAKVVLPAAGGDAANPRIPRAALVQRGEVSGVYVIDGQRLALRQLRLGQTFGDQVEVLSGLKDGDVIATDPVAALQALVAQRQAAAGAGDD